MSSVSKERILGRIRDGLHKIDGATTLATAPDGQVFKSLEEDTDIVFAENFTKAGGKLIFCNKKEDFFDKMFEYKQQMGWEKMYCWGDELNEEVTNAGIEIINSQESFIADCEAGVTLCESMVARTGSILVSSALGGGRRLSIYPPIHIVVGYTSQIVPEIGDALEKIKNTYPEVPSLISLTTGPSRTADIEKTLVLGAHGPKELILFLIDDTEF